MTLASDIAQIDAATAILHSVIHGTSSAPDIATEGGLVPTLAKMLLRVGVGSVRGAWLTATAYALNDAVTQAGAIYRCATAHTSGTFATDLAAARWVLAATDPNGLLITATGSATARTLADWFADRINVKDFGAVGDGVADDTVAIQAALTYAATVYATVFLPRGDYKITAALVFDSATGLFGEGIDQSVIRYYGAGGTAIELEGTAIASKVKIHLCDFALYDAGSGVNGVNMSYCHYSNLTRLRVYGFDIGVTIGHCWNDKYDFVISESNTQDGFNLSSTDANALTFVSCQGVGNARAGFYSEGGRSVLVAGCTWEANTQYGVYLAGGAANRPLSHTFHGCYIEGNGSFEFYSDTGTAFEPQGITIRDCYFEFIAGKATQAIRIVDGASFVIDGNTFDNMGGSYDYSLYMAAAGSKSGIRWGRNLDKSTNGVYSEIYYENQARLEARAVGRFTVSGAAIATSRVFGVASITYISTGVYEVTLQTAMTGTDYCVTGSAENGAAVTSLICSPAPPASSTVFRIATTDSAGTATEARTVNFTVHD